ncbi:kinase-like protein [Pseudovirgaria hyperparasitica]|uniref:non-specific serine/threonine protein kinase n=1 Tax=Pseudovirgaria hyperparasitica TaxID=470096 RepID=A0A6A6WB02_9PEZI|nr:kinase-like protein [Pseudovirgaria hyperparasitica]KAF2759214.1 kinase-like protein [Pseudovirgaria hyperparasitica]
MVKNNPCIRHFSRTLIDRLQLFEEERLPWYRADQFYPVHTGETFFSKYKVVGKLGYGPTVWLCRDMSRDSGFVALKVCTRDNIGSLRNDRDLKIYEHLEKHSCLIQPPMHMTIRELQCCNPSKRLNEQILNWTLFNLLRGLTFLHDEVRVVHTDNNPSNIILSIEDESLLPEFERAEAEEPSPMKVIDEFRTIYGSRRFSLPKDSRWGQPVLCDFEEARIGQTHKVLFNMEWSCSVDIWNLAVLLKDVSATHHVAAMLGYLGSPPFQYLGRSEVTNNVFDEKGHWKGAGDVTVPEMSLERAEIILEVNRKGSNAHATQTRICMHVILHT